MYVNWWIAARRRMNFVLQVKLYPMCPDVKYSRDKMVGGYEHHHEVSTSTTEEQEGAEIGPCSLPALWRLRNDHVQSKRPCLDAYLVLSVPTHLDLITSLEEVLHLFKSILYLLFLS